MRLYDTHEELYKLSRIILAKTSVHNYSLFIPEHGLFTGGQSGSLGIISIEDHVLLDEQVM